MLVSVPVIKSADVLIVGGVRDAVSAALELRSQGRSVALATPYNFPGEDIYGRFDAAAVDGDYRPASGKARLERALVDADVWLGYEYRPVRPLLDGVRRISGWVFSCRGGFVAIAARCVVDATHEGFLPVQAQLSRRSSAEVTRKISVGVIGECACDGEVSVALKGVEISGVRHAVCRYGRQYAFRENDIAALHRIEADVRSRAWAPGCTALSMLPDGDLNRYLWEGFTPGNDIPLFRIGRWDAKRIGEVAGRRAPRSGDLRIADRRQPREDGCTTVRFGEQKRYCECPQIPFELDSIPVGGEIDVLVVGGGTAGAAAAIAAARNGARVLCAEQLSEAGGQTTAGRIGNYWFGIRCGFTRELDAGVMAMGDAPEHDAESGRNCREWKGPWLLREMLAAGVDVRFRTVAAGVLMQDRKVCGAVLLDDHGDFSIVRARVVIDATGNSVVAAQAGATLSEPHYQEPAVQGAGLSPFIPGQVYCNSDYQFIDESDAEDVTRAFVMAHDKFQQEFDVAVLPGTRERRRIVGDVTIQPQDVLLHRRWRDTVAVAASNFDTHGFIQHPMLMMRPPDEEPLQAHVPLRALLPVALDGLLVTGLSISAHRDAMPVLRMQPDVQNQGYAAGIAAAMAAAAGCPLREVNIAELQRRLLEKEILPLEAVASVDGEIASGNLSADQEILAKIFMRPDKGRREVKSRFLARPNLDDALILAFLGDSTGRELLRTSISGSGWDEGWNYRGMGQFGASGSPMDCLLFALRSIGGAAAEIMRLLAALEPESAFSHFRAVTMYFMRWPHQEAAARLERLLECPGFSGNHVGTLAEAMRSNRPDMNDNSVRNRQLKELYTAAALCCCAPGNDFARKILTAYRDGMNGVYSAFAAQVLEGHGRARISK